MPSPVRKRMGVSGESPSDKSVPIWVAIISGVSGILVGVLPVLLPMLVKPNPPGPPAALETADVRLKPPVRCNEFPDDQAIIRTQVRWLRDLCLNLEKEAKGTAHFPAVVFETNPISKASGFKGRVQCGVYTAIDGYAFLADPKKEAFIPLNAYVEREGGECAFRFEAPSITGAQSVLLVLMISGEPVSLTQAGIRSLTMEVNP